MHIRFRLPRFKRHKEGPMAYGERRQVFRMVKRLDNGTIALFTRVTKTKGAQYR